MGCSRSDSVRGGRDAVVAESGDLDGDGPFKRVARSVALLLIGLTVLRSRDADADALVCGFGEGVGSSMRDREWGGDWVTGEFKTASLTGSNFAGIVDAAGWRTKGGTSGEGRLCGGSRVRGDRWRVEWSSRVEDGVSSVVVADGGGQRRR